ncbi:MAG: hypothetical protein LC795_16065 [Acidobacteria bacterium]|nr:hypothetical protein [Acidobacteriota bacterium]
MSQLFATFEVNRVPRWPLMSRLVALSVVAHGLFIVAVVYVPAMRGLLHLASSMSGIEFVREDYDKTLLGQRATIIQLGPHEKLYYPPDYFGAPEVAETTQLDPMMVQPAAPPPPVYRPRRVRTPKPAPAPTPEEVAQATPTPETSPTPATDEARKAAEARMDEVEKQTGVKRPRINPGPWEDLAKEGKQLFDEGKLNVNSAVDVSATAERDADGRLKPESVNIKWNTPPADATTEMMARKVITAVSESKMLSALEGAKGVDMSLKVGEQDIAVVIGNQFPSAAEAEKVANAYALLLLGARVARDGTEDAELYRSMKVSQDGSRFVITFKMPKDAAGKMIADILSKKAAKDAKDAAAAQNKG